MTNFLISFVTLTICLSGTLYQFKKVKQFRFFLTLLTFFLCLLFIFANKINKRLKVFLLIFITLLFHRNFNILIDLIEVYKKVFSYTNFNNKLPPCSFLRKNVRDLCYNNSIFIKENFHKLPSYPSLIVSNYPNSRIEEMFMIVIPVEMCVVMNVIIAPLFSKVLRDSIVIKGGEYETLKTKVEEKIKNMHVFVYVSNHSYDYDIGRVKTGMFRIAKELDIPVTPVTIDQIYFQRPFIPKQNFSFKVDETFKVKDPKIDSIKVKRLFEKNLKMFQKDKFCLKNQTYL